MRLLLTQPAARSGDGEKDLSTMAADLAASDLEATADDILILPELVGGEAPREVYEVAVRQIARRLGAHVVGGSHLCAADGALVNRGIVVSPSGQIIAEYEKANRYGSEVSSGFRSGSGGAVFRVGGVTILALICADFWHWQAGTAGISPDIVVVPAFSVTRRARPHMARARWRHQIVAKAYELTAFIGVSDWAPSVFHVDGRGSGAAGFARPDPPRVRDLFTPLGERPVAAFEIDLEELSVLRRDRVRRGFMHRLIDAPDASPE